MIAEAQEQATCKICGTPIMQKGGKGHRKRIFCDKAKCRKAASRAAHKGKYIVSPLVTNEAQARIATLEQELVLSQQNLVVCQEKLSQTSSRIQKLEHQVEIQRQRLGQSYQSTEAKERIAALEQELTQYRELASLRDRAKLEARFMDLGEQLAFHTLTTLGILGGSSYWHDFMRQANDEKLQIAIAAAEYYLEGLVALRGDPRERHITELERQVKDLQARLNIEEHYRTDTLEHPFRRWVRRYQWKEIDFFKRFLDDTRLHIKPGTTRLMGEAPRSLYEARLRAYDYSEEDIALFQEAWKDMLFSQL